MFGMKKQPNSRDINRFAKKMGNKGATIGQMEAMKMMRSQSFVLTQRALIAACTVLKEQNNFSPEQLKQFSDAWLEQMKKLAVEAGDM